MAFVNTLVVTGYGTNSHQESAHAAHLGGANNVDILHFSDIVSATKSLTEYDFIIFPGGFLDGDDLGAAQAAAQRWLHLSDASGCPLLESLCQFLDAGGLVLGICNGFQLLVKLGILPAFDGKRFERHVSLSHNDSARYEDRWIRLRANPNSPCIFTKGLDLLDMPVRHGEGKIVTKDAATLARLETDDLIALRYVDPTSNEPTQTYPHNPNGSPNAIAGLTDPTGRVLGLMPHPEAFHHVTNHPLWTRGARPTLGTAIMENAIKYLHENPCKRA